MMPNASRGDEYPEIPPSAIDDLCRHLRGRYFRLLAAPAAIILVVETARAMGRFDTLPYVDHRTWDVVLFVLAAITAVAMPMLYRVLFARAHRQRKAVRFPAFYRFEHTSMKIALSTPWISVAASLIAVTGMLQAGIFLMTLYAAYVFFPSTRRLGADARLFRVRPPTRSDQTATEADRTHPEETT